MKMTFEFDQEEMCLLLTLMQDLTLAADRRPCVTALLAEMRGRLYINRHDSECPPETKGTTCQKDG